jgi:hypothetical protein
MSEASDAAAAAREQIEELERVIAHLEGRLQGRETDRKRRIAILKVIIETLRGLQ